MGSRRKDSEKGERGVQERGGIPHLPTLVVTAYNPGITRWRRR